MRVFYISTVTPLALGKTEAMKLNLVIVDIGHIILLMLAKW